MEVVILTGMSGAGKTIAANYLEDMGFFCVDNAPPQMLVSMLKTFIQWEDQQGVSVKKVAFVVDVRSVSMFSGIKQGLEQLEKTVSSYRLIFLDASDQTLLNRYKQSRRNHPLAEGIGILEAITEERKLMQDVKNMAQDVIDTTNISPLQLKDILYKMFTEENGDKRLSILVQSFGFKYGMPLDCDNVFDVRFIPNPYYEPELRKLSGLDRKVRNYVYDYPETTAFMNKLKELLQYTIPFYTREGKVRLNIGIGCTGGRHRSVAMAVDLADFLAETGYEVQIDHRDLKRDTVDPDKEMKTVPKTAGKRKKTYRKKEKK